MDPIAAGDVIRCELDDPHTWFYCEVREVDDAGALRCEVIEAQSWSDLALSGYLPGREYRIPSGRVLSVVRRGAAP